MGKRFPFIILYVVLLLIFAWFSESRKQIFAFREKEKKELCSDNLRSLGQAALLYADDYDSVLPPYRNLGLGWAGDSTSDSRAGICSPVLLKDSLRSYLFDTRDPWYCPSDPYATMSRVEWGVDHAFSSYRFNFRQGGELRKDGWYLDSKSTTVDCRQYHLITDANLSGQGSPPPPPPRWVKFTPEPKGGDHQGSVNVCFLDGHVSWLPPLKRR